MTTAVIKDNHVTLAGIAFFKVNAPVIELGAHGEKRTPVFSGNYLEKQDRLPAPTLDNKITQVTVVEIDTSKTSKSEFFANINVAGVFGVGEDTAWEKAKDGHYKLVWLAIDLADLKRAFNDAPKARNSLASYGGDGRAVHQVLIAMEAHEATRVASGTNFDVSIKAGVLSLTVKGGSNSSSGTEVSLKPGTCYGYLLAKPHWNKDKSEVEKFTDDQWSVS
jgi:hypothetical protein